jgi:hypothetical protein
MLHNLYLGMCGLVKQTNSTQKNLCLVVCNVHRIELELKSKEALVLLKKELK